MNATFENFRTLFNEAEENAPKWYEKGNKAAGTRLRKSLNEMRKLAAIMRKEISEAKNAKV